MEDKERDFRQGKLPLPVGKSDWEYVAAHNYCVDKTFLIRDLLATDAGVALFTRPRRFGKTTAMQMLKCFFEKRGEGEDFDALAAEARRQIDEKNYAASLEADGITDIMKFGYAFYAKKSAICR